MTKAQKAALLWLRNRNGDGVFEKNRQVLIAGGERAPIMRKTWQKLVYHKMVEFYADGRRVRVTPLGVVQDLTNIIESENRWDDD